MANRKTPKPEIWLQKNDYLLRIEKWARAGLTNKEIAEHIGISYRTLVRWYPISVTPEKSILPYRQINFNGTFEEFLMHARECDDEVESSLKMAATGYWVEEQYLDKKGKPKVVRKWIPPSDKAQAMWLKNKRPDMWNKESEKKTDTSALERLDAILGSLSKTAQEDSDEDVDDVNNT